MEPLRLSRHPDWDRRWGWGAGMVGGATWAVSGLMDTANTVIKTQHYFCFSLLLKFISEKAFLCYWMVFPTAPRTVQRVWGARFSNSSFPGKQVGACGLGGSGRTGWLLSSFTPFPSFCQTQNLVFLAFESLGKASMKTYFSLRMTGVIVNKLLLSGLKKKWSFVLLLWIDFMGSENSDITDGISSSYCHFTPKVV